MVLDRSKPQNGSKSLEHALRMAVAAVWLERRGRFERRASHGLSRGGVVHQERDLRGDLPPCPDLVGPEVFGGACDGPILSLKRWRDHGKTPRFDGCSMVFSRAFQWFFIDFPGVLKSCFFVDPQESSLQSLLDQLNEQDEKTKTAIESIEVGP